MVAKESAQNGLKDAIVSTLLSPRGEGIPSTPPPLDQAGSPTPVLNWLQSDEGDSRSGRQDPRDIMDKLDPDAKEALKSKLIAEQEEFYKEAPLHFISNHENPDFRNPYI